MCPDPTTDEQRGQMRELAVQNWRERDIPERTFPEEALPGPWGTTHQINKYPVSKLNLMRSATLPIRYLRLKTGVWSMIHSLFQNSIACQQEDDWLPWCPGSQVGSGTSRWRGRRQRRCSSRSAACSPCDSCRADRGSRTPHPAIQQERWLRGLYDCVDFLGPKWH
jgi:hypothetical protein